MRLRKYLYDLTAEDFAQYPVWAGIDDARGLDAFEYEDDEDEEEEMEDDLTMTPYPVPYDHGQPLPLEIVCLVAAELTLADGDIFPGFLYASGIGRAGIMNTQPQLFKGHKKVGFYCGSSPPKVAKIAENYRILGKSAEQVFPAHYRSKILFVGGVGEPHEGVTEGFEGVAGGFCYLDSSDGKTIKFLR